MERSLIIYPHTKGRHFKFAFLLNDHRFDAILASVPKNNKQNTNTTAHKTNPMIEQTKPPVAQPEGCTFFALLDKTIPMIPQIIPIKDP